MFYLSCFASFLAFRYGATQILFRLLISICKVGPCAFGLASDIRGKEASWTAGSI